MSHGLTETEHQILVMCWAKKMVLAGFEDLGLLVHVPNGGGRSKREAAVLKNMGVKPGVSDLFLPVPTFRKHGLWIEMKADHGAISDEQWKWIYAMRRQEYQAVVCRGWRDAVKTIKEYLGGVQKHLGGEWPVEVDQEMDVMEQRLIGKGGNDNG